MKKNFWIQTKNSYKFSSREWALVPQNEARGHLIKRKAMQTFKLSSLRLRSWVMLILTREVVVRKSKIKRKVLLLAARISSLQIKIITRSCWAQRFKIQQEGNHNLSGMMDLNSQYTVWMQAQLARTIYCPVNKRAYT